MSDLILIPIPSKVADLLEKRATYLKYASVNDYLNSLVAKHLYKPEVYDAWKLEHGVTEMSHPAYDYYKTRSKNDYLRLPKDDDGDACLPVKDYPLLTPAMGGLQGCVNLAGLVQLVHPEWPEPELHKQAAKYLIPYLRNCRNKGIPQEPYNLGEAKRVGFRTDVSIRDALIERANLNKLSLPQYLSLLVLKDMCQPELYVARRRFVDKIFAIREYKIRTGKTYPGREAALKALGVDPEIKDLTVDEISSPGSGFLTEPLT